MSKYKIGDTLQIDGRKVTITHVWLNAYGAVTEDGKMLVVSEENLQLMIDENNPEASDVSQAQQETS